MINAKRFRREHVLIDIRAFKFCEFLPSCYRVLRPRLFSKIESWSYFGNSGIRLFGCGHIVSSAMLRFPAGRRTRQAVVISVEKVLPSIGLINVHAQSAVKRQNE